MFTMKNKMTHVVLVVLCGVVSVFAQDEFAITRYLISVLAKNNGKDLCAKIESLKVGGADKQRAAHARNAGTIYSSFDIKKTASASIQIDSEVIESEVLSHEAYKQASQMPTQDKFTTCARSSSWTYGKSSLIAYQCDTNISQEMLIALISESAHKP